MPRLSKREWQDKTNESIARRHEGFRRAAEVIAAAFAQTPGVQSVALIGSVAKPAALEVTRRGWELLHEAHDIDLAVWVDRLDGLAALQRARRRALQSLLDDEGIGVAHHQVDVFLIEPGTNRYLGRLCNFSTCPKGHQDCAAKGCGRSPFLKQHDDFELYADALAEDRIVRLHAAPGFEDQVQRQRKALRDYLLGESREDLVSRLVELADRDGKLSTALQLEVTANANSPAKLAGQAPGEASL